MPTEEDADKEYKSLGASSSSGSHQILDTDVVYHFCNLDALSRYPYKYVPDAQESERLANAFFNHGQIWQNEWSVYYVPLPTPTGTYPLLFVPIEEAHNFLNTINTALSTAYTLDTNADRKKGLVLCIGADNGYPWPLYLSQGRSCGQKGDFDYLIRRNACTWETLVAYCDSETADAFKEQVENCYATARSQDPKRRNRNRKAKRRHQLLRPSDRCFRPAGADEPKPDVDPWKIWLDQVQIFCSLRGEESGDKFPSAPFAEKPILISFDCEWMEESYPRKLTEVGISVLDTLKLCLRDPGDWSQGIHSYHLRVQERCGFLNSRFCQGSFIFNFGATHIVKEAGLAKWVDSFFEPPFGFGPESGHGGDLWKSKPRQVILVGHAPNDDIMLLRDAGSDNIAQLFLPCPGRRVINTQKLYSALVDNPGQLPLEALLRDFNLPYSDLHNAGNDARYTMEVLLHMALRAARAPLMQQ